MTTLYGDVLVSAVLQFLSGHDEQTLAEVRRELESEVARAGDGAFVGLRKHLVTDYGWDYCARDPLAQRIHHILADRFLAPESSVTGTEHLDALAGKKVVICANHVSYADANVIEALLHRAGYETWADRLTALAGPKVFTSRARKFSSLCFGTIKVPQSADVSSEEAALNPREVARAARQSIEAAHKRLVEGDALILFGEGTRSRTGAMQPMLAGVARYLELPGTWILPAALTGSGEFFPVGDSTIRPTAVTIQFGPPVSADALRARVAGDRQLMVDAIGLAIADQLAEPDKGVFGDEGQVAEARKVLKDLQGAAGGDA